MTDLRSQLPSTNFRLTFDCYHGPVVVHFGAMSYHGLLPRTVRNSGTGKRG